VSEADTPFRPVLSVGIVATHSGDPWCFPRALRDLARLDATVKIDRVSDIHAVVSGMSELHLREICDRLSKEDTFEIDVSEPRVIYLETVRKQAAGEGKFIRPGQYAHVMLRLEPRGQGSGYEFVNESARDAVPPHFVSAVDAGIREAMRAGVVAGHEMVDVRAVLCGGSYHSTDSNEMAFKIAASMAFKESARHANPVVLEPMMAVDVTVPEEFVSVTIGDLNSRRGRIHAIEHNAASPAIHAIAPLAELIGYESDLRLKTQGRAEHSMRFGRYGYVPPTRGESGGDEAGVTANRPKSPTLGSRSAAVEPEEFDSQ
jgi:elongation factor G